MRMPWSQLCEKSPRASHARIKENLHELGKSKRITGHSSLIMSSNYLIRGSYETALRKSVNTALYKSLRFFMGRSNSVLHMRAKCATIIVRLLNLRII